jgi:hypothetical protein
MTLYSAVLFVHLVSVLGLGAALSFELMILARLRRAGTLAEARIWAGSVPSLPLVAIASMLFLLASGIYLAGELQAWTFAWPRVAFFAMFLIAPLGAMAGRRMRAIRQLARQQTATDPATLRQLALAPLLSISLAIRIATVLGIVLIMAAKPSLDACLVIVAVSVILGLFAGLSTKRPLTSSAAGQN